MKMLLTTMGRGMGNLKMPEWGSDPNRGLKSKGSEKKASQISPCMNILNRSFPVLPSRSDWPVVCIIDNQLNTNIG